MVNKHGKGKRREREAQLLLEEQGYLTERKPSTRWSSDDFWETFDILALKPDGSEVRLIQVKSNTTDFYSARGEITEWIENNNISNIKCEVWLKRNYKPWRKDILIGKPCDEHSLAFSDSGCPEAKNFELVRCDTCGFWIKKSPQV